MKGCTIKENKLHIELLGGFLLIHNGVVLNTFISAAEQKLLAYLLLNSRAPQSRQHTAFLFWPENSERQAYANLRQRLFHLKKAIPDSSQFILADDQTIRWNPDGSFILDVTEFERCIAFVKEKKQETNKNDQESTLKDSVDIYHGKLLIDCYDEWIDPFREQLHQKYLWALQELINLLENKRDYSQAIAYAQKLKSVDLYNEKTYRNLIRLYALDEDRIKAIHTYQECEQTLKDELDIAPGAEIMALYNRIIKDNYFETEPKLYTVKDEYDEREELVGRKTEWNILLSMWKNALQGTPHMMVLTGDPGIGKTKLGRELLEYVGRQGYPIAYAKSYEAIEPLSFGPIISWLRSNGLREALEKLRPVWLTHLVRLLPELLERYPDLPDPDPLEESWQRGSFFEAICRALSVNDQPCLLVLDDLQWCDSESLDWLNYFFHSDSGKKVLVVGMLRTVEATSNKLLQQFLEAMDRENHLTKVSLGALTIGETIELASLKLNVSLTPEQGQYMFKESEGNPLFIVETTREGNLPEPPTNSENALVVSRERVDPLPQKIEEIITERFRNLSKHARDLLGLAATMGREFSTEITSGIIKNTDIELFDILDELREHHIVQELQTGIYDFTHDKLREVAYRKLSETKRRWLHQQIGLAIEQSENYNQNGMLGTLAFHFARAGYAKKAIHYYISAAGEERALLSKQDTFYYRKALDLLEQIDDSASRNEQQYEILQKLAVSLIHAKGNNPAEITRLNERIGTLAKTLNRTPSALELFTRAMESLLKGNLKDFEEAARQMFELSEETGDTIAKVESCYLLGGVELYVKGDAAESYRYFSQGLELYEPHQHHIYMQEYDLDGGMVLQAGYASCMWMTCRVKEAQKMIKRAYLTALSSQKPFNIIYMQYMFAWWRMLLNKPGRAQRAVEKFNAFKTDYELFHWNIHSKVILGWSLAHRRRTRKEGIVMMRGGIDELQAYPFVPDLPHYFGILAELLGKHGNLEEAFSLIDQALSFIDTTGVRFAEAEIYRIRGQLHLLREPLDSSRAESSFQKALAIAAEQNFTLFEYRAKMCLSRLV